MASVKIATLLIRTVARPIAARIKNQAKQHERFREFCVDLAQLLHRSEVRLRTNILGEPARHIRPLSETRAIENGANFIAEGFLFTVAASIIIAETWRSSRSQSKRRDNVDDQLEDLNKRVAELTDKVDGMEQRRGQEIEDIRERNDELTRVLERIIWIGLRGGWTDVHSEEWQREIASVARIPLAIEKSKHQTSDPNTNS
ncbi:OPA3-domain-containing protein [Macrolepiota fuliginosa MF-IS2]|uniref:OPA3-domain-containing protein n=1 Tax=Macrolepiota fuliginosa MF-IS2 TaxID=1400762 RepID=A0A9P6BXJ0_9AGAR|nr:OPA3-domain-containing protein [Macrolepiota fuliginosa MF-IS2]